MSFRAVRVLLLVAAATASWVNDTAGTCAGAGGPALSLLPGSDSPRCAAGPATDADPDAAVPAGPAPFDLGTRLYFRFEDGRYYWGEVVAVLDPIDVDGGGREGYNPPSGWDLSRPRYRVLWTDGDYTVHDHDHVVSILAAQDAPEATHHARPSSVIAAFGEPVAPADGGHGRRTCPRVRLVEEGGKSAGGRGDDGVEEVTAAELYVRYVARSAPVLIEGMWREHVADPAVRANWTMAGMARRWQEGLDRAREQGTDREDRGTINVMYSEDLAFQRITRVPGRGYGQIFPPQEPMNFTDFLPLFEAQEHALMARAQDPTLPPLDEYVCLNFLPIYDKSIGGYSHFGRLIRDTLPPNPLAQFVDESEHSTVNVWAQGRQRHAAMHHDANNNILGVLSGTKTVYLVDPTKHDEDVYAGYFPDWAYTRDPITKEYSIGENTGNNVWHRSPVVDVLNPDLERLPRFRKVLEANNLIQCDMGPGDGLYLPEPWWHEVRNGVPEGSYDEDGTAGANVAINYWWDSNPVAKRMHHSVRDLRLARGGIDWVRHGEELDAELGKAARRERAARRMREEEEDSEDYGDYR